MKTLAHPTSFLLLPLLLVASTTCVAAQPKRVVEQANATAALNLDFTAMAHADGTLTDIVPNASLPAAMQAMVRARVATWRYAVGSWQGKPVSGTMSQRIVAEAEPVASGGFALRIREVRGAVMPVAGDLAVASIAMNPPDYPVEARMRGITGTFVYAMRVDAGGKAYDVELVDPDAPSRGKRMLDTAARAAIARWTLTPTTVEGVPVVCHVLMPIEFALGHADETKTPDLAPYRARFADACPAAPELTTPVIGTLL